MADNKANVVAQENIWKEAVHRETAAARNWYEYRFTYLDCCNINHHFLLYCITGRDGGDLLQSMI